MNGKLTPTTFTTTYKSKGQILEQTTTGELHYKVPSIKICLAKACPGLASRRAEAAADNSSQNTEETHESNRT